jgi:outer membrane protein assembly factor BamB
MNSAQSDISTGSRPLRLWPGVAAAVLMVLMRLILPVVSADGSMYAGIGGFAASVIIILWWLFFSRAPWAERLGVIALMAAALFVTRLLVHESIRGGMMGMMPIVFGITLVSLGLVAGAAAGRRLSAGGRRAALAGGVLLACAVLMLIRTAGLSSAGADLHWRWTPTPEERLLAQEGASPELAPAPAAKAAADPVAMPASEAPTASASPSPGASEQPAIAASASPAAPAGPASARGDWPGFRGPARDGVIRGVRIATDWAQSPPVELWRRPVGPGWSSFAVRGDLIYTQEQRGEDEVVSCYSLTTGKPVWRHADRARFYESNGGPGPRATPTLARGRVYTLGATGILNALDAGSGSVVWSRNAASDTGAKNPGWGFAGSPLVVGDVLVVATSGRLAGYDVATGTPRWYGPTGGSGYSSPHLVTIDGVAQVVLMRGSRTISVAPVDGTLLWEHVWEPGVSIVQPALAADGDILIAAGDAMGGQGIRRIEVTRGPAGWTAQERWTTRGLKPYFNDFVVHEGHAFGFDGSILASIDLADGTRKWKGGRYGSGQLVLLPEQDLMLVVSEEGELALVKAAPDQFTELARVPAIEGKTWNHPVLIGDVLLMRNDQEMAAFRLRLASN